MIGKRTVLIAQAYGELGAIGIHIGWCQIIALACMYQLPIAIILNTRVTYIGRTVSWCSLSFVFIPSYLTIGEGTIGNSQGLCTITYPYTEVFDPCIITHLALSDIGRIAHRMLIIPCAGLYIILYLELIVTTVSTSRRSTLYPIHPRRRNRQILSGGYDPCLPLFCPFPRAKASAPFEYHVSTKRQILCLTSIVLDKEGSSTFTILITSPPGSSKRASAVFLIIQDRMIDHLGLVLKLIGTEVNQIRTVGLHLYLKGNRGRERCRGRIR